MQKSTTSNKHRTFRCAAVLGIVVTLLLGGCAREGQWSGTLVPGEDAPQFAAVLDAMAARDALCPKTLVADLQVDYESPLEKRRLQGFLQFSLPGNYKFIVTSPLGQMVWGTAGNRRHYQVLNTMTKQYIEGGMESFVLNNKLPFFLIQSQWGNWLTGRVSSEAHRAHRIVDIRKDKENRGVWITVKTNSSEGPRDHLLINPERQQLIERVITDLENNELATVSYSDMKTPAPENPDEETVQCLQPGAVTITGLPWNSHIGLNLSRIETRRGEESYSLPQPVRYFRQYRP
ncbi:hypothetical protein JWG39_08215 [Desulforhopalus vacuolatus]|uniref:hypothetical protein n=1 Tax=Desulforhopalus vacuolatus TaxID=40414 RepID=UPI00196694AB|nr:hypothetical protein [Desulforhopalus vacuolatus]MBM9519801.1 hypothetical protein [Desulforhopalus vacuolatus]